MTLLIPASGSVKKRKRKGRGNASGMGGECGRGHKGQKSRSGFSRKIGFEGGQMPLYKRIPKKRGFNNDRFSLDVYSFNIDTLLRSFSDKKEGATITLEDIYQSSLAPLDSPIKLLGNGDFDRTLNIEVHYASKSVLNKAKLSGVEIVLLG